MSEILMFERDQVSDFRTVDGIARRAGVRADHLGRLVLKELVDNALDAGANCRVEAESGRRYAVVDDGPGIADAPEQLAHMFSFGRPFTSSKMLRLPTRGALGNGLRVVAAVAHVTGLPIVVGTRGYEYAVNVKSDGSSVAERIGSYQEAGTRVEVVLNDQVALLDIDIQSWAQRALRLAKCGSLYRGRTSILWYSYPDFRELVRAAQPNVSALQFLSSFDGFARRDETFGDFRRRCLGELSDEEIRGLHLMLRSSAKPVSHSRLGRVGKLSQYAGYARQDAVIQIRPLDASPSIQIPVVLEAWARPSDRFRLLTHVNRTPTVVEPSLRKGSKAYSWLEGCGLSVALKAGRQASDFLLNVQTPYMPLVSDGKAPDLSYLEGEIVAILEKTARTVGRTRPARTKEGSQKALILGVLDRAIAHTSGEKRYRFALRQLYYSVRTLLRNEAPDLSYEWFANVITEYEDRFGDIPGMYRDPRGVFYHPHTQERLSLGTLSVEAYRRPELLFNKVLYIEKEGFFQLLIDEQWPEKHDCALMTSKGYATRAARDLIDLIVETNEEATIFCIHDADGPGTVIYQSLQGETKARRGRAVEVVNLGLEFEEAVNMGLPVEPITAKREVPVAEYVSSETRRALQRARVELNSMTSPQFLSWLDAKMSGHGQGKVIPSAGVLTSRLHETKVVQIRDEIVSEVLEAADIDQRVEDRMAALDATLKKRCENLRQHVTSQLREEPKQLWSEVVDAYAETLV